MATGHFYFDQDSVGAPTDLRGPGTLIALLDWALDVAGATYWEKVYSGTNKAVYRSKTGIRPYLRIDDTYEYTAIAEMFETMTDVDTGTGRCPDNITQTGDMRIVKDSDNDSANFYIVGDSEFFFLAINGDHQNNLDGQPVRFRGAAFGEVASLLAVDNYPCVLIQTYCVDGNAAQYYQNEHHILGACQNIGPSSSDNSGIGDPGVNPIAVWLRNAAGTVNSSGGVPWPLHQGGGHFRMDVENPASMSPIYIQCSNGSTSSSSTAYWNAGNGGAVTRARLPYLYRANWMPGSSYGGPVTGDVVTIGSSQFRVIVAWTNGTSPYWGQGVFLIRMTDDEPDRS